MLIIDMAKIEMLIVEMAKIESTGGDIKIMFVIEIINFYFSHLYN